MRRLSFMIGCAFALLVGTALAQSPVSILADLDPNSATGITAEGLVADNAGRLYTSDTASRRLFRVATDSGAVETLGTLPRSTTGMAFDASGNLYLASGDRVLRLTADKLAGSSIATTDVQTYTTGVAGANGLAFDGAGRLYVSGGATGNIYLVSTDGMTTTWASGFTSDRQEQRISTNGLAFGPDGRLYSSNTGSGGIDRITINPDGSAGQPERFVTDQRLLGADGITFAANGDLYVDANERNAIVKVSPDGTVSDVASNDNNGPLEFPSSPSFSGNALYTINFDIARGANAPNTGGIGGSIARIDVGVGGAPLPYAGGAAQPAQPTATSAPAAPTATTAPQAPTATSAPAEATSAPAAPTATPAGAPATLPNTADDGNINFVPWLLLALVALLTGAVLLRRGHQQM